MTGFVFLLFGLALVIGVPIGAVVLWRRVQLLMAQMNVLETRLASIEAASARHAAGDVLSPTASDQPLRPDERVPSSLERPTPFVVGWPGSARDARPVVSPAESAPVPGAAVTEAVEAAAAPSVERRTWSGDATRQAAMPAGDEASRSEWEVVLGTSWLNKIGVLVLILGLGFLLAYSFAYLGAAGRIAIGYAVSAALLGGGMAMTRRPAYKAYGQGLTAGGWAAMYITTFAAHGIESARVIESGFAGVLGLFAVATGMIVHSLKFRSLPMTALAYLVAYATLAQTPLSGFSLAAALPLTASLLTVAVRAGWPALSLLGLVSTYGLFVIREQLFPSGALGPDSAARYFALGVFWLLFEIADHLDERRTSPIGVANVAGLVGAVLLRPPSDSSILGIVVAALAGAVLASSAMRLHRDASQGDEVEAPTFTSAHLSAGLAAGLFAWAAFALFAATQAVVALLLDAEWLIATGMVLRQRPLRTLGAVMAAVTSASALGLVSYAAVGGPHTPPTLFGASLVAVLIAATWYLNDTWIRRSPVRPSAFDRLYSWAAFALLAVVGAHQSHRALFRPLALVASALLLERARHVRQDFYPQAMLAAAVGVFALLAFAPAQAPEWALWIVQPTGIMLALWLAWRVVRVDGDRPPSTGRLASPLLVTGASALLATFQWQVLPAPVLAAAWAATAAAMALLSRQPGMLRGFDVSAAGLLLLGAMRSLDSISRPGPPAATDVAFVGVVIAVLLAAAAVRRSSSEASSASQTRQILGATLGTFLLTLLTFDAWRSGTVTVAWGAEGLLLLGVGFLLGSRALRVAGLAVLGLCLVKLFGYDLNALDPLPRILSFVGLGLVLLLVSWIYTRTAGMKDIGRNQRN